VCLGIRRAQADHVDTGAYGALLVSLAHRCACSRSPGAYRYSSIPAGTIIAIVRRLVNAIRERERKDGGCQRAVDSRADRHGDLIADSETATGNQAYGRR